MAVPPTPLQVEAMQALMVHRSISVAAASIGKSRQALWRAAAGCAKRAPHIDGWSRRA
jgi:hypothetical protein